jgi:hypothetical protein
MRLQLEVKVRRGGGRRGEERREKERENWGEGQARGIMLILE